MDEDMYNQAFAESTEAVDTQPPQEQGVPADRAGSEPATGRVGLGFNPSLSELGSDDEGEEEYELPPVALPATQQQGGAPASGEAHGDAGAGDEEERRQQRREYSKKLSTQFYTAMKDVPDLPFQKTYVVDFPDSMLADGGACPMLFMTGTAKGDAANKVAGLLFDSLAFSVTGEKKKKKKKKAPKKKAGAAEASQYSSSEDSEAADSEAEDSEAEDGGDAMDVDDGEVGKGHVLVDMVSPEGLPVKVNTQMYHVMLEQLVTDTSPCMTTGIRVWIFEVRGARGLAAEIQATLLRNNKQKPVEAGGKAPMYMQFRNIRTISDLAEAVRCMYERSTTLYSKIAEASGRLHDPDMRMWDVDCPVNPANAFAWQEAVDRAGQINTRLCEVQRTWMYYAGIVPIGPDAEEPLMADAPEAPTCFPLWGLMSTLGLDSMAPQRLSRYPMPLLRTPRFSSDRRINSPTKTWTLSRKWLLSTDAFKDADAPDADLLAQIGMGMEDEGFDPSSMTLSFDPPYAIPTSISSRIEYMKNMQLAPPGVFDDTVDEEDVLMKMRAVNMRARVEAEAEFPAGTEEYSKRMKEWYKENLKNFVSTVRENLGQGKMPKSRDNVLSHFFATAQDPVKFWKEENVSVRNLPPGGNFMVLRSERMAAVAHLRAGRMKLLAPQYWVAALQSQKHVEVGELGLNYKVEGDAEDGKSFLFRAVRMHMDDNQFETSSFQTEKSRTLANCDYVTVYYDEVRPGFFDSDEAALRKEEMTERHLRSERGIKDTSGPQEKFSTQVTVVSRRCTYMINSNCPARVDKTGRNTADALGTRMVSMEDGRSYKNKTPILYFESDALRERNLALNTDLQRCLEPAVQMARWVTVVESAIQAGVIPQVNMTAGYILAQNVFDELKRVHNNPYPSVRRAKQFYEHMRSETILIAIWVVCFSEYSDTWRFEGGTASRTGVLRPLTDDRLVEMLMEISRWLVVTENTVANTLMLYETSIVPVIHHRVIGAVRDMIALGTLYPKPRFVAQNGRFVDDHNYIALAGDFDKVAGQVCSFMHEQSSGAGKADSVNISVIQHVFRNMRHQMTTTPNYNTPVNQAKLAEQRGAVLDELTKLGKMSPPYTKKDMKMRLKGKMPAPAATNTVAESNRGAAGNPTGAAGAPTLFFNQLEKEDVMQINVMREERCEKSKSYVVAVARDVLVPSESKKSASCDDLLFHTIQHVFGHIGMKNSETPDHRLVVCDVYHAPDDTTNVDYMRVMDITMGPFLLEVHNTQPATSKLRATLMNFSDMTSRTITPVREGRNLYCWSDPVEMAMKMRCAQLGMTFSRWMMPHNMTQCILSKRLVDKESTSFYSGCDVVNTYPEEWIEDDKKREADDIAMKSVIDVLRREAENGNQAAFDKLCKMAVEHQHVNVMYNFASMTNTEEVVEYEQSKHDKAMEKFFKQVVVQVGGGSSAQPAEDPFDIFMRRKRKADPLQDLYNATAHTISAHGGTQNNISSATSALSGNDAHAMQTWARAILPTQTQNEKTAAVCSLFQIEQTIKDVPVVPELSDQLGPSYPTERGRASPSEQPDPESNEEVVDFMKDLDEMEAAGMNMGTYGISGSLKAAGMAARKKQRTSDDTVSLKAQQADPDVLAAALAMVQEHEE